MKSVFEILRRLWQADTFSPTAFVLRAIVIAMLYGISELLGLRDYTTFLTGTSANPNLSWQTSAVLGLIHLLLYVAFILLVPISLLTAALLAGWNRRRGQSAVTKPGQAVPESHSMGSNAK